MSDDQPAEGHTWFVGVYPDGSAVWVEMPYTEDLEGLEARGVPEDPRAAEQGR